jgi:hypothetical protein
MNTKPTRLRRFFYALTATIIGTLIGCFIFLAIRTEGYEIKNFTIDFFENILVSAQLTLAIGGIQAVGCVYFYSVSDEIKKLDIILIKALMCSFLLVYLPFCLFIYSLLRSISSNMIVDLFLTNILYTTTIALCAFYLHPYFFRKQFQEENVDLEFDDSKTETN